MDIVYATSSPLGGSGLGREAFYEARAIYAAGWLRQAVVYKNRQTVIPPAYIRRIWFQPTKVFSSLKARYYYGIKKRYFDWVASHVVRHGCTIFQGWMGEALLSLQQAKAQGTVSFLAHPAPHVLWSTRLLAEEDALYGRAQPAPDKVPVIWRFPLTPEYHLREYNLADYIVVHSSFCRQTFVDAGIEPHRVLLMPQGVDTQTFTTGVKQDNVFRVLFVGGLTLRKGVQYLLEAWAQLHLPQAELLLVGSIHHEVQPLLEHYRGLQGLRLVGRVQNPVHLYQQASVCVLPSLSEGSAKVTYEAMACGLPVIVTPNAGAEIKDGMEGFLVPPRGVDELQEKLLCLYGHEKLRQEMGQAARALAERYTWEHRSRLLLSAYQRALQTG
ncbi:MAG TPA: glycosyltransferase family 4 protein [Candidatus Tectomicrobia bacterium]